MTPPTSIHVHTVLYFLGPYIARSNKPQGDVNESTLCDRTNRYQGMTHKILKARLALANLYRTECTQHTHINFPCFGCTSSENHVGCLSSFIVSCRGQPGRTLSRSLRPAHEECSVHCRDHGALLGSHTDQGPPQSTGHRYNRHFLKPQRPFRRKGHRVV